MSRRLVIRPQAESEILQAHHWYEARRPGLGHAFGAAIDHCMTAIADRPLAHARVRADTRRALVRRFPYAIYFRVMPDEAVMHGRQHPRRWLSRR